MFLMLKPLFMEEITHLPLDEHIDLSDIDFQGIYPFVQPVHVKGEIRSLAEVVSMHATATVVFNGVCDRCAEPFEKTLTIPMEHVLVTSLGNADNDELLLVQNYRLELTTLTVSDVLLDLPSKQLCRKDCKGLCPHCGKNLNEGLCGCRVESGDPRLAVLKQLLE